MGQDPTLLDPPPSPFSPGERSPAGGLPSPPRDAAGGTKPTLRERLRRKPKPAPTDAPGAERRPTKPAKKKHARVSAADTLSDLWGGAGGVAIRTGKHVPFGRCLQFQAPVAGEMLDEAIKGSFIDKLAIQPIVRARGRFDLVAAIAGPPAIVLAIESHPERAEMLMPLLYSSVKTALPQMVPAIKRVRQKEADLAVAAEELLKDEEGYEPGMDPVHYVIGMIFAGWTPPPPESEQAEPTTEVVTI